MTLYEKLSKENQNKLMAKSQQYSYINEVINELKSMSYWSRISLFTFSETCQVCGVNIDVIEFSKLFENE